MKTTSSKAHAAADYRHEGGMAQDERVDLRARGAERHPDAELAGSLGDGLREQPVESHRGQHEAETSEERQHPSKYTLIRQSSIDRLSSQRAVARYRHRWIDARGDRANRFRRSADGQR
jgi:hypothetical protein